MKKISDILRKKQVLYPLIALAGFVEWLLTGEEISSAVGYAPFSGRLVLFIDAFLALKILLPLAIFF